MIRVTAHGMTLDLLVGAILLVVGLLYFWRSRVWNISEFFQSAFLLLGEVFLASGLLLQKGGGLFSPWACAGLGVYFTCRFVLAKGWAKAAWNLLASPALPPVLLVGTALILVYLPSQLEAWRLEEESRDSERRALRDSAPPVLSDHPSAIGLTLSGQEIPLFASMEPPDATLEEAEWLTQGEWEYRVIRVADANRDSNCHGHVFGHQRHWVLGRYVDVILKENQYAEVENPLEGDVAVYRDPAGQVTHTGIVRGRMPDGLPLVESKWGALGIYLHTAADCPYGRDSITFFRSPTKVHHHLEVRE